MEEDAHPTPSAEDGPPTFLSRAPTEPEPEPVVVEPEEEKEDTGHESEPVDTPPTRKRRRIVHTPGIEVRFSPKVEQAVGYVPNALLFNACVSGFVVASLVLLLFSAAFTMGNRHRV